MSRKLTKARRSKKKTRTKRRSKVGAHSMGEKILKNLTDVLKRSNLKNDVNKCLAIRFLVPTSDIRICNAVMEECLISTWQGAILRSSSYDPSTIATGSEHRNIHGVRTSVSMDCTASELMVGGIWAGGSRDLSCVLPRRLHPAMGIDNVHARLDLVFSKRALLPSTISFSLDACAAILPYIGDSSEDSSDGRDLVLCNHTRKHAATSGPVLNGGSPFSDSPDEVAYRAMMVQCSFWAAVSSDMHELLNYVQAESRDLYRPAAGFDAVFDGPFLARVVYSDVNTVCSSYCRNVISAIVSVVDIYAKQVSSIFEPWRVASCYFNRVLSISKVVDHALESLGITSADWALKNFNLHGVNVELTRVWKNVFELFLRVCFSIRSAINLTSVLFSYYTQLDMDGIPFLTQEQLDQILARGDSQSGFVHHSEVEKAQMRRCFDKRLPAALAHVPFNDDLFQRDYYATRHERLPEEVMRDYPFSQSHLNPYIVMTAIMQQQEPSEGRTAPVGLTPNDQRILNHFRLSLGPLGATTYGSWIRRCKEESEFVRDNGHTVYHTQGLLHSLSLTPIDGSQVDVATFYNQVVTVIGSDDKLCGLLRRGLIVNDDFLVETDQIGTGLRVRQFYSDDDPNLRSQQVWYRRRLIWRTGMGTASSDPSLLPLLLSSIRKMVSAILIQRAWREARERKKTHDLSLRKIQGWFRRTKRQLFLEKKVVLIQTSWRGVLCARRQQRISEKFQSLSTRLRSRERRAALATLATSLAKEKEEQTLRVTRALIPIQRRLRLRLQRRLAEETAAGRLVAWLRSLLERRRLRLSAKKLSDLRWLVRLNRFVRFQRVVKEYVGLRRIRAQESPPATPSLVDELCQVFDWQNIYRDRFIRDNVMNVHGFVAFSALLSHPRLAPLITGSANPFEDIEYAASTCANLVVLAQGVCIRGWPEFVVHSQQMELQHSYQVLKENHQNFLILREAYTQLESRVGAASKDLMSAFRHLGPSHKPRAPVMRVGREDAGHKGQSFRHKTSHQDSRDQSCTGGVSEAA